MRFLEKRQDKIYQSHFFNWELRDLNMNFDFDSIEKS
jgi:hypothetical protein